MGLMMGGGARPRQDRVGVMVQQVQGCPLVSYYSYDCFKFKKCSQLTTVDQTLLYPDSKLQSSGDPYQESGQTHVYASFPDSEVCSRHLI